MEERLILKVRENKSTRQKTITIPSKSKIKKGDYVEVKKLK